MARLIDQGLLDRLSRKLGVGKPRVYALIQAVSAKNRVPRHLGALLIAAENGISLQKYASAQDLAELRGVPHQPIAVAVAPEAPRAAGRQNVQKRKVPQAKENTVFVVHGRDSKLRDAMYQFLGALGLRPQEWGHALRAARGRGGNPYVNDAVTKIMERAQAVVVLLSPDDEVRLKDQFLAKTEKKTEGKLQGQARPNVLFETGIAIGAHHKKTVIVQVGEVKPFTDIGGMHIVRLTDDERSRNAFANRLEDIGCDVDKTGDHWLSAGDFSPSQPKKGAKKKAR